MTDLVLLRFLTCFGVFWGIHAGQLNNGGYLLSIQKKLVMTNKKSGCFVFLLSGVVVGY
jgi:hypothetical protein